MSKFSDSFFTLYVFLLEMKPLKRPNKTAPPEQPIEADVFDSPFPEPVELPLEDVLDLHPFAPHEIRGAVEEYLAQCHEVGFSVVRLIHGKGKGIQRESIRALLSQMPFVRSFHDAPPEAGGWGATIVLLDADLANRVRNR